MAKGKLIVFEGLDCSFKETTSNAVYEELKKTNEKVIKFEFPNYGNPSAFFVEQLLKGSYSNSKLDSLGKTILFITDIFHTFETEIKKYYEDGYIVILDRYYISNIYYQNSESITDDFKTFDILKFDFINNQIATVARGFNLPRPDFTVYMNQEFEDMKLFLSKKKNKDINELNLDYLKGVYNAYNYFLKDKAGAVSDFMVLKCKDMDNTFKSTDKLANEAIDTIKKHLKGVN